MQDTSLRDGGWPADDSTISRAVTGMLSKDYADNLAEGYRRHPTQFVGPLATAHVSLNHPGPFETSFQPYMQRVFEFLLDPRYRQDLNANPARTFDPAAASHALTNFFSFGNGTAVHEQLLYEIEDLRFARTDGHPSVVWRAEVHREYVSITLFARIHFENSPGITSAGALQAMRTGGFQYWKAIPHDTDYSQAMSQCLFSDIPARLNGLLGAFLVAVSDWQAKRGPDLVGRTSRAPGIFARFNGPVVPWTVYGPALKASSTANEAIWHAWRGAPPSHDGEIRRNTGQAAAQKAEKCLDPRPFFPRFRERSLLTATPDINWALACTDEFLRINWPGFEQHLLNGSKDDCVTCYMQNGHSLYISGLGSRVQPEDQSPSQYAVFYDDFEGADLNGPKIASIGPRELHVSKRISRLVGRLHELGVARLSALLGQAQLKSFAQFLRHIEAEVQQLIFDESNPDEFKTNLKKLEGQLEERLRNYPTPINYGSHRTAYNTRIMYDLIDDLGVISIPGRQPYDRFIRRRFNAPLQHLSSISDTLKAVKIEIDHQNRKLLTHEQLAETGRAAASAHHIATLQTDAERFAGLLVFYYLPLILAYGAKGLVYVANLFLHFEEEPALNVSAFGLTLTIPPAHLGDYAFGAAFVVGIALLLGRRILGAHRPVPATTPTR